MIIAVLRRRLKEQASFEDFISAWKADEGFGVPARVFNAVSLDDPREILSIGFGDIDAAALGGAVGNVAGQEAGGVGPRRHRAPYRDPHRWRLGAYPA